MTGERTGAEKGQGAAKARAAEMWAEYERSNTAGGDVPARCPKRLVQELLACDPADAAGRREKGQAVLNMLCLTSRIQTIRLKVVPGRPSDSKGHYDYDMGTGLGRSITVFNSPEMAGRPVDGKSFLETLCHEFCHHWDVQAMRLRRCYHTPGFYRRVENLYRRLTA